MQLLDTPKIPEDALNRLFDALKVDATIKYLRADSFSWSLESIKSFAEFFKDLLCRITGISFINALNDVNKIDVLLDALGVNGTIENIKLAHNYLRDKGLDRLIDNLSKKSIKTLELQNTNIRLDNGIINNFIKFLKESNTEALDISSNPITQENLIKLLEDIKETKISDLDISGIFFDNVNVPALSSFVKNTKLAGLNFSLSTEVSEESKKALSDAIKENKSLIGCNILVIR
ncbi:leucine-rich repeat domain-containing protein [Rickettsia tamurae]|uniref:hypothetical protein n=1 Tax=Rickettsia tamurae TaxID=334545 RepID=UPI001BFCE380|nr:hypothetical protein [Rickettsia tamurae]